MSTKFWEWVNLPASEVWGGDIGVKIMKILTQNTHGVTESGHKLRRHTLSFFLKSKGLSWVSGHRVNLSHYLFTPVLAYPRLWLVQTDHVTSNTGLWLARADWADLDSRPHFCNLFCDNCLVPPRLDWPDTLRGEQTPANIKQRKYTEREGITDTTTIMIRPDLFIRAQ